MKKKFTAEVMSGHKDSAVEVPFNPVEVWGVPARPLWRGRKGHAVKGTLNKTRFDEGFIVPRAKKFYLLIDKDMSREAGLSVGDAVKITVEPNPS
ncbi:MAG TPA: DUF1905 domain-containing protein [Pyrinomonadaceae bacterium]|jgi:hypothetical protein|nr:DUF1905 domain-containing protein [Pyrinomonadaceae bacterium]